MDIFVLILPLLAGWLLDKLIGDPSWLPHPIVGFGKLISFLRKTMEQRETPGEERSMYGCCAYCIHLWSFCVIDTRIICYESLDRRGGFGRSYLLLFGRDYAYQ